MVNDLGNDLAASLYPIRKTCTSFRTNYLLQPVYFWREFKKAHFTKAGEWYILFVYPIRLLNFICLSYLFYYWRGPKLPRLGHTFHWVGMNIDMLETGTGYFLISIFFLRFLWSLYKTFFVAEGEHQEIRFRFTFMFFFTTFLDYYIGIFRPNEGPFIWWHMYDAIWFWFGYGWFLIISFFFVLIRGVYYFFFCMDVNDYFYPSLYWHGLFGFVFVVGFCKYFSYQGQLDKEVMMDLWRPQNIKARYNVIHLLNMGWEEALEHGYVDENWNVIRKPKVDEFGYDVDILTPDEMPWADMWELTPVEHEDPTVDNRPWFFSQFRIWRPRWCDWSWDPTHNGRHFEFGLRYHVRYVTIDEPDHFHLDDHHFYRRFIHWPNLHYPSNFSSARSGALYE